jgi:hypothetical protein
MDMSVDEAWDEEVGWMVQELDLKKECFDSASWKCSACSIEERDAANSTPRSANSEDSRFFQGESVGYSPDEMFV